MGNTFQAEVLDTMPWKEIPVSQQRLRFIARCLESDATGERNMSALCREFGISRKTGYALLARYHSGGGAALQDRSRAPQQHPNAVAAELEAAIVQARACHPTWGPAKLRRWLERQHPATAWPAVSTIGALLQRHGLTVPRRRVHRTLPYTQPLAHCDGPNRVWCADFKGWFKTADGRPCHPFTLSDGYSRYLLRVQALMHPTHEQVQPLFMAAFREYGLPQAIRTDNGPPFGSRGLGGWSRLSVWWLKLGIVHERIEPGQPQQNGRHERMHRTLKAEATQPPQANQRAQQRTFAHFVREFNDERPHQALGQVTPASVYVISARAYPRRLPAVDATSYGADMAVRRVRSSGEIKWQGQRLYLSDSLVGEWIGLEEVGEGQWAVHFGPQELAVRDERRQLWLPPRVNAGGES
jgi:putative transposase